MKNPIQLKDICNPVRSSLKNDDLIGHEGNYPVFGAPGEIAKADFYQEENASIGIVKDGAGVGRVMLLPEKSSVLGTIQMIVPKEGTDLLYLFYLLKGMNLSGEASGATIPHIYFKNYGTKQFCIPSLEEQKRIGKELKRIQGIISKDSSLISQCDETTKSRFVEMFGECDMNKPQANWKRLDTVTTVVGGTTPKTGVPEYWGGEIKWIAPAEIPNDAFLISDTQKHITEAGKNSCSLTLMPSGTVLFSTRAPIGKVAISNSEMCCNQGFKNFICSSQINNVFLYQLLKMNIDWLQNQGTGTTFKEISKSSISSFLVPIPSIEKQKEFSVFLIKVNKLKLDIQKEIDLANELLALKFHQYFDQEA
jgi:type I restriction enzyme S subunit